MGVRGGTIIDQHKIEDIDKIGEIGMIEVTGDTEEIAMIEGKVGGRGGNIDRIANPNSTRNRPSPKSRRITNKYTLNIDLYI